MMQLDNQDQIDKIKSDDLMPGIIFIGRKKYYHDLRVVGLQLIALGCGIIIGFIIGLFCR